MVGDALGSLLLEVLHRYILPISVTKYNTYILKIDITSLEILKTKRVQVTHLKLAFRQSVAIPHTSLPHRQKYLLKFQCYIQEQTYFYAELHN